MSKGSFKTTQTLLNYLKRGGIVTSIDRGSYYRLYKGKLHYMHNHIKENCLIVPNGTFLTEVACSDVINNAGHCTAWYGKRYLHLSAKAKYKDFINNYKL